MPVKKLKELLDRHNIEYSVITHTPSYTAQGTAATAHVSGNVLAKTVMIKADGKMAMAVLPASLKVNFDLLREVTGADKVTLASEQEFQNLFPGCEVGAMPPFGNLYGIDVYVSEELAADEEICFNAGTHTELIKMSYSDFESLVKPKVVSLTAHLE